VNSKMPLDFKEEIKKAVVLAKECLTQAGHSRKLKECPICNPEYARDLIKRQRSFL